jgi:hypothetical protein
MSLSFSSLLSSSPQALALFLAAVATPQAAGIVIRHDRDEARYLEEASRYPMVAQLSMGGTGTLIGPRWVLTAAHVADATQPFNRTARFGDAVYQIDAITIHPEWRKSGVRGRDVALMKLDRPVEGISPIELYADDDEAGQKVVFVGAGLSGNGLTGPDRSVSRLMRAATNTIDRVNEASIFFTFHEPPEGTDLEGISGPGDSGGPALIERDGKLFTLGVSSTNSGGPEGECRYGTIETYARVSTARDWILSVMAADPPDESRWSRPEPINSPSGLPATPAAQVAAAYFAALATTDAAGIVAFNRAYRTAAFLGDRTEESMLQQARGMAERFGRIELFAYSQDRAESLMVLTRTDAAEPWVTFQFSLEERDPPKVGGIFVTSSVQPPHPSILSRVTGSE